MVKLKLFRSTYLSKIAMFLGAVSSRSAITLWRSVRKMPLKIIGGVYLVSLILTALIFELYLANSNRVIGNLTQQYEAIVLLQKVLNDYEPTLKGDQSQSTISFRNALDNLSEQIINKNTAPPNKTITKYTFRSESDEFKSELDKLYMQQNQIDIKQIQESTDTYEGVAIIIEDLQNKYVVEDNIPEYLSFLESSIISLKATDIQNNTDLSTLTKMFQFIKEATIQYQQDNNIESYDARVDNISSELGKELEYSWGSVLDDYINTVRNQRSNYESILGLLN